MNAPKRSSAYLIGSAMLAAVVGLSACQQQQQPEPTLNEQINEDVTITAEPADEHTAEAATDTTVDPSAEEVAQQTVVDIGTTEEQLDYSCTPDLAVQASYIDSSDQVILETAQGSLTLDNTNEGTNPSVYQINQTMDGNVGITQWRVAHAERSTAVMRTGSEDDSDVTTYECKAGI